MSKIIGIDLGTTNSAVAVMSSGNPEIIENKEGVRTTPSIIAISKTNERLVGVSAKRQAVTNPKNTVSGVKRYIGHRFADEEIQRDTKLCAFDIKEAKNDGVSIVMRDKEYSPEELSAMVLKKLKEDAEERLGEKITEAVITVPAYFDDNQRKATKDAGKIAGLNVKRIINEPTAAALAYGFNKKKNEQIAVFDFGGGTFDISILEVGDDVVEVKSTDGDSHMGGRDIDKEIVNWIANEFKKTSGIDLIQDPLALQRLDEAAENAKKELSETTETEINIPFITSDNSGPKHLLLQLSRATLEEMSKTYIDRAIDIAKRAIDASPFKASDIDEVILVGGQTRMPYIQQKVKELFGKEPNKSINPDEVVALGAAIQGGILRGDVKDVLLLDVIPLSLGIETLGGVVTKLIERNTTVPTSKTQTFSTAADNQTSVDINILQGERTMSTNNRSLGRFILEGINPAPRGVPQVEVSFDIDANGILSVVAKDKTSGKEQSIKIEASSGLSEEEIEKMTKDALAHSEEDKKQKDLIDVRNSAEQLIYTSEKFITDNKDKMQDDKKKELEDKIKSLRSTNDAGDMDKIKKEISALSATLQTMAQNITSQQNESKATEANSENTGEGNVKDAEVEEDKEGK